MATEVKKIADLMGAEVIGEVPDVGGGAFGAARLARILKHRLVPGEGRRPGRPTVVSWTRREKVPMSDATWQRLRTLAQTVSTPERKVSPMQVAGQILEAALSGQSVHHGL